MKYQARRNRGSRFVVMTPAEAVTPTTLVTVRPLSKAYVEPRMQTTLSLYVSSWQVLPTDVRPEGYAVS